MKTGLVKAVFVLFLVFGATMRPAVAGLPDGYPAMDDFHEIGHVDGINDHGKSVVVDDRLFEVSPNVVVNTPTHRRTSHRMRAVRSGMKIGAFVSENKQTGERTVREIWVLPKDTKLPDDEVSFVDAFSN